jgi:diacylglycerol O-acyltransferase / wax synthase
MATQGHKDRLSPVDASFLHQERQASHMHVGGVAIFEGPPPAAGEFVESLESRLHLVPRYRQKLAIPPLEMGRPFWVDDASFNLAYHVRHTALPSPGSEEQLRQLVGRIFSQRLDRSKPLWEIWLVQGLTRGGGVAGATDDSSERGAAGARFALISKSHHALIDGISGVDIATVLFDLEPVPKPPPADADGWTAEPEPSEAELVAEGVKELVRTPTDLAGRVVGALQRPGDTLGRVREAAEGVGEVVWAGMNPAPDVPLNVPIGPHRRVWWVRGRLEDFKRIKNALGGTVNDVVLAVVAGAMGRWLRARGVRTEGLELRALVPVSIRGEDESGALGNRIAAMRGPLPVYARDPVERLRIVKESMAGLKESKQALGAEVISGVERFAPPTLLAQASRLNFSTRLFNLIVTNVPGPQFPLYMLGRELQEIVPVAFLPEDHALAIAIMSYNGKVDFGLLGDYDAMPDIERVGELLEEGLEELLEIAREREPKSGAKRDGAGAKRGGSGAKRTTSKAKSRAGGARSSGSGGGRS